MASIGTKNGRKRVIVAVGNRRHSIPLGEVSDDAAADVAKALQRIADCKRIGQSHRVDQKDLDTIMDLPEAVYDRVAEAGLMPPRVAKVEKLYTLGELIADVLKGFASNKPNTLTFYSNTYAMLKEYFPPGRDVRMIGPKEADAFVAWLRTEKKIGNATVARRIKGYRLLFKRAMRWGYVTANPFADMKAGASVNFSRKAFVTLEDFNKIMAATSDLEFKAVLALCRYGALRCPSEVLALRWVDVRFDEKKLLVHSPKTEYRAGGESRIVPLFPELEQVLLAWYAAAEEGAVYVVMSTRDAATNWRTRLERLCVKAGVQQWPKLYHNMRASRESELVKRFPLATVCKWLGHRPEVAAIHYLTDPESDENFTLAVGERQGVRQGVRAGAKKDENGEKGESTKTQKPPQNVEFAGVSDDGRCAQRDSNPQPSA